MPMMIRFYRKDLYENEGITPGRTWEEYFEDLKMFDNPEIAIYGGGSMALSHISIVYEYLTHLHSFGGKIWDIDDDGLRCVLDSDEALAALENFVQFKSYSDPTSSGSTWSELGLMMSTGRVANAIQFADYASVINNPATSLSSGKWGYTPTPSGPKGSFSTFAGAGIGVSKYTRNPEASWLWLQYATSLGTQIVAMQDPIHHSAPTRMKAYDDPVIQQTIESGNLEYLKVVKEIVSGNHIATLVSFPGWPQLRVILSRRLANCWLGRITPRQALKEAKEEIDKKGPVFNLG
jgi:multiple sugar transport system substrate-binding protein